MAQDDIETERQRLEGALYANGFNHGPPTESYQRGRAAAIEEIQRRLAALPPKPRTRVGMEAGTLWVWGLLGDMPARPTRQEPEHHGSRDYDPIVREFGPAHSQED